MSIIDTLDIVIVNWNGGLMLSRCIDTVYSAARYSDIEVKIYVVDNASSDGSADNARRACPLVTLLQNRENVGFGAACNQGARAGSGRYILFLNPDTEVYPGAISAPVLFLKSAGEGYGACGVQLLDDRGQVARTCARRPSFWRLMFTACGAPQALPGLGLGIPMTDWAHDRSADVDHVIGAFYVMPRKVFEALGGFDERFFVYLEDLDLSCRIIEHGLKIRYLAEVSARHIGGGTSQVVPGLRMFYSLRSRILLSEKRFVGLRRWVLCLCVYYLERMIRVFAATASGNVVGRRATAEAYKMLYSWRRGRVKA